MGSDDRVKKGKGKFGRCEHGYKMITEIRAIKYLSWEPTLVEISVDDLDNFID
jgi:hypothetical protein